ncbi:Acetolactate synthase [Salix suchowensis]|nr:Acetolactate synthase [Salix suchowensis]
MDWSERGAFNIPYSLIPVLTLCAPSRAMRLLSAIVALSVACSSLSKANNWDKPCFHGECAYDTIGTEETGYGSIKIYGSPKSITDITPASGWVVLDCDPNLLAQDIRLVCRSDDDEGCNHIYEHDPIHRIVRLPESVCTSRRLIYGRSNVYDSAAKVHLLGSRACRLPLTSPYLPMPSRRFFVEMASYLKCICLVSIPTLMLSLQSKLSMVHHQQSFSHSRFNPSIEPVSFILVGGNFPGLELDSDVLGSLHQRDADNIFKSIAHAVSKAANAVKDVAVKVGTAVKDVAETLNVQKHFDLLDVHQHCGSSDAELKVSVDGNAHAEVSVGAILIGHIIPPKIEKAGAFARVCPPLVYPSPSLYPLRAFR